MRISSLIQTTDGINEIKNNDRIENVAADVKKTAEKTYTQMLEKREYIELVINHLQEQLEQLYTRLAEKLDTISLKTAQADLLEKINDLLNQYRQMFLKYNQAITKQQLQDTFNEYVNKFTQEINKYIISFEVVEDLNEINKSRTDLNKTVFLVHKNISLEEDAYIEYVFPYGETEPRVLNSIKVNFKEIYDKLYNLIEQYTDLGKNYYYLQNDSLYNRANWSCISNVNNNTLRVNWEIDKEPVGKLFSDYTVNVKVTALDINPAAHNAELIVTENNVNSWEVTYPLTYSSDNYALWINNFVIYPRHQQYNFDYNEIYNSVYYYQLSNKFIQIKTDIAYQYNSADSVYVGKFSGNFDEQNFDDARFEQKSHYVYFAFNTDLINKSVLRSTDLVNWTDANLAVFDCTDLYAMGRNVVITDSDALSFVSDNFGKTWGYGKRLVIRAKEGGYLIIQDKDASGNTVLKRTIDGKNWDIVYSFNTQDDLTLDEYLSGKYIFIYTGLDNRKLIASFDNGSTWQEYTQDLKPCFACEPDLYCFTNSDSLFYYSEGTFIGKQFSEIGLPEAPDPNNIISVNGNTFYLASNSYLYKASNDAIHSWIQVNINGNTTINDEIPHEFDDIIRITDKIILIAEDIYYVYEQGIGKNYNPNGRSIKSCFAEVNGHAFILSDEILRSFDVNELGSCKIMPFNYKGITYTIQDNYFCYLDGTTWIKTDIIAPINIFSKIIKEVELKGIFFENNILIEEDSKPYEDKGISINGGNIIPNDFVLYNEDQYIQDPPEQIIAAENNTFTTNKRTEAINIESTYNIDKLLNQIEFATDGLTINLNAIRSTHVNDSILNYVNYYGVLSNNRLDFNFEKGTYSDILTYYNVKTYGNNIVNIINDQVIRSDRYGVIYLRNEPDKIRFVDLAYVDESKKYSINVLQDFERFDKSFIVSGEIWQVKNGNIIVNGKTVDIIDNVFETDVALTPDNPVINIECPFVDFDIANDGFYKKNDTVLAITNLRVEITNGYDRYQFKSLFLDYDENISDNNRTITYSRDKYKLLEPIPVYDTDHNVLQDDNFDYEAGDNIIDFKFANDESPDGHFIMKNFKDELFDKLDFYGMDYTRVNNLFYNPANNTLSVYSYKVEYEHNEDGTHTRKELDDFLQVKQNDDDEYFCADLFDNSTVRESIESNGDIDGSLIIDTQWIDTDDEFGILNEYDLVKDSWYNNILNIQVYSDIKDWKNTINLDPDTFELSTAEFENNEVKRYWDEPILIKSYQPYITEGANLNDKPTDTVKNTIFKQINFNLGDDSSIEYNVWNHTITGNYPYMTNNPKNIIKSENDKIALTHKDAYYLSDNFCAEWLDENKLVTLKIYNNLAISAIVFVSYKKKLTNETITEYITINPNQTKIVSEVYGYVWYVYKFGELPKDYKQIESESWKIAI